MKELSIEEKAKRYDEALIRGSKLWESDMITRENYEYIFPEVKESENKRMIQYFKDLAPFDKADELYEKYGFSHKDAIAWLERQVEHANFRNKIQVGDKVTRNEDGVLVNLSQLNRVAKKQGEQKPADETKFKVGDIIKSKKNGDTVKVEQILSDSYCYSGWDGAATCYCDFSISEQDNWELVEQKPVENSAKVSESSTEEKDMGEYKKGFECGKQRVLKYPEDFGLCKKSAWSEEDEYCRHQLIVFCENCMVQDAGAKRCAHWLKSLRPQNTWKPSESDIRILEQVIDGTANPINYHATLHAILEKLKKLREE